MNTAVPRNSGHFCSTSRFSYPVETAGLRVACQPSIHFYVCKANQPVPSRSVHYYACQLYCWTMFLGRQVEGNNWDLRSRSHLFRVDTFTGETIKKFVCGYYHCLALTDSGKIFGWSEFHCRYYSSIADTTRKGMRKYSVVPVARQFGKAVQIAAHGCRYAAKFADGTVRAWSFNEKERGMEESGWIKCRSIDEAFAPDHMCRTFLVPQTVAQALDLRFNDKETADVCFRVGTGLIRAHKQVLIEACPSFDEILQSQSHRNECDKKYLTVQQCSYNTFYEFIFYVYTGELKKCPIFWEELFNLADNFGLADLKLRCEYEIGKQNKKRLHSCENPPNDQGQVKKIRRISTVK